MKLREAKKEDELIISHWLSNQRDCELATSKNVYKPVDYYSWLEAEDQHCYFLEDGTGTVIGYGEIWVDDQEKDLELAHLIINPAMRNKGLGKILISLLEEKAKEINFPVIYMRVNPENRNAIQCYLHSTYEIDAKLNEVFDYKWTWLKKELR